MKKFIVSLAIIFCSYQIVSAQFTDRNLENASYVLKNSYRNNPYKINHVKSIIGKKQTSKGLVKTDEALMNASSYVTVYTSFAKNGKEKSSNVYQFKNDTLMTDRFYLRHGKDTFNHMHYKYDIKNRMIGSKWEVFLFWVPVREWKYDYNDKDKETAAKYLDKKGETKYKYEFDYYDNGSKKETRYYKRDKLKNRWTFECDPKGEEVKKVKTGNYCTKKTFNSDGSFLEVFEYKYDNGKPTKTICYYTADTLLTKYEEYRKNGELKQKWEYTYDKRGNKTEILFFKNNKLKKRYTYTYNEKNLYTKSDEFNGKGKLQYSHVSEYTYY
jgi:YD repeat-containing protein